MAARPDMTHAHKPMSFLMRLVLSLVVVNAYAAAASLIIFPNDTRSTFFWAIEPPINARLFGVLYLAAGSLVLHAVIRGRWEPARFVTAMVPAFTGLMLLTTLVHSHAFDPGAKFLYWLAVYVFAPLAALVFYRSHERVGAEWRIVSEPVAPLTRTVAVTAGALAALFTGITWIAPDAISAAWPWSISPLMVRVFASWLSAFAVGLLWFGVDSDWRRVRPVAVLMVASAALMLMMLVLHREALDPRAASAWAFGWSVITIGLVGVFMLWRQRRYADARHSPR